jgi:hypothetical protein
MARKAKPADGPAEIFRLKVVLRGSDPSIWRRLEVRDCTLAKLHGILQDAMGWDDYHLHTFTVGGVEFGPASAEWDVKDERRVKLSQLAAQGVKKFRYTYDMGDGWEHEITFQKSVPAEPGAKYPRCIDGARACPPEDCGGIWGYADLLEVLSDPEHEEYEERLEWLGGEFDPEAFDLEEVNARLAR